MVGSDTEATVMLNVVPGLNTGITAFNAGLSSINAQFQNITDAIGQTFGVVDSMIVSAGVMVAQFGMGAANAFGEFEQGMQIVKAVSQQSGQSMAYLKQEAQDFAVQYRTGIDSITEGLQTLGRAGLNSAQEQTEVLEQGLQTAKLEGRELNGVLEEIIQNTTLLGADTKSDQFGEQAEYLNNLLVGTSLSSPIDTHDISETLKYSGGMVAAAGGTIATDEGYANEQGREIVEDYMGAVAAFGQKGVKGSIAGTALRAFFNKPATQDKSVVEALESIGLAPEDLWNDEETMKPVSEQIELIQTQMNAKNVSKMDQMQLWSKIVGGKMGQQMMKLDAQDIREMTTDIKEAGSAKELSEQTFNTYNQQMNKFSEEGQKAFREFGRHIVTAIKPALDILTRLMDLLSNPIVSFGGFMAFMTMISHAMQAVMRIAGRLKTEIGWVFSGKMSSPVPHYNLPRSKYADMQLGVTPGSNATSDSEPSIKIRRPSDSMERVQQQSLFQNHMDKKTKVKQEYFNTVKSNISTIRQQMSEMIDSIDNRINNLDMNVDINLDDVNKDIQNIGTTAKTVIKEVETQSKASLASIRAELASINESNVLGTGSSVGAHPVTINNRAINEIMRRLPKEAQELLNSQLRDGTLSVLDLFSSGTTPFSDPFYRDRNRNLDPTDGRQSYFRYENRDLTRNENGRIVVDEKEFDKFSKASMVPHQITQEELDIARQYMGMPNMDDFVKFQLMMKQAFPDMPHEWIVDEKTGGYVNLQEDKWNESYQAKIAADEKDMYNKAKAVLDALFEGAKEAAALANANKEAELAGIWGGLSEDEFNSQYYKDKLNDKGYVQVNGWKSGPKGDMPFLLPLNESRENLSGVEKMWDDINDVVGKDIEGRKELEAMFDYEKPKDIPRTYADYERMQRETREKQSRETVGFSQSVPGVISQDALNFDIEQKRRDYQDYEKFSQDYRTTYMGDADYTPPSKSWKNKVDTSLKEGRKKLSDATDKLTDKFNGFAKTMGSSSTSAIGKTIDLLGGKFNVAIMAATAAMEIYNYAFGQWQKQTQEHQTKLSEAQDKMSEAEGNIREEYLKNNPDATQADADKAIEDAYLAIEDNNYDMSALDENTQALYVATYQVQRASDLLEGDAMDGNFGINGTYTDMSDGLSGMFNLITGNTGTPIVLDSGEFSDLWTTFGSNVHMGSITENQGNAVLTGSQNSDDYVYSKENAAIFAADVWKALDDGLDQMDATTGKINNIRGLDNFFGSDSQHFKEVTQSIFRGGQTFGGSAYDNMAAMLGRNFQQQGNQHQLQMFLKNNQKEAQKLAKGIRKFEKANKGKSPLSFFTDKKGNRVPQQKALKNLEVKDKDLVKYLRSLSIKTGMSAQQLLMASQLQQMQDLNQVMTEQLQPQVIGLAQNAYQQLSAQQNIGGNTSNTSSGAWSTYSAAAAIASKLNVLVEQALDTEMQQDYIADGGTNKDYIDNPQRMKADMVKAFNTPESQRTAEQRELVNNYGKKWFESYYLSGWESGHPNASQADKDKALANFDKTMSQYDNFGKLIADTRKGANDYYTKALVSAYDASKLGEDGDSPSGGSGGGGGDGGSDKGSDKGTGTKKERVDLVLCNKKEIPKLNVNLFKKAPQFTVLNKNFKLRDIKINTQDKPKAVLDSLKNAIIDTQKRMDPKIIQDEEAEYDPVAATNGNKTPSGSTSTTTD